jgi:formylglycine-generating enzyme required for sulfatase activity/serine/threonine protein kinase
LDAPTSLHPTDQTLHDYGMGKLDDASAGAVHAHLENCAACRRRTAERTSDSFLNKFRAGQSAPSTDRRESTQSHTSAPVPIETLPPELAAHKDYEVVRELGRGGMGVVYLVRNRLMGRNEVLKVMGRHLVERPEVSERFLREIRAVASLRHPNIVAAHHAFHVDKSIAFTMEFVDGYDLSKMVKSRGPLPVAHACLFIHQAALGLQHAHEEGMVHRDIKPGNLMVSRRGEKAVVKVLDFGLAKAAREGTFDSALTHAGQMLGTPDFIAPEQSIDAQKADIRADIYSLGCTLYYLLTGGPPFQATSLYDLLQAHHSMDAKLLNFVRPEVPTELAAVIAKMMAKEPERRFQTPAAVSEALVPFYKRGAAKRLAPELSLNTEPAKQRSSPIAPAVTTDPKPRQPNDAPGPESQWASIIVTRDLEAPGERLISSAAPSASGSKPPWKRKRPLAIAAASLFSFIALGIIIYLSIDRKGARLIVVQGYAGAANKDDALRSRGDGGLATVPQAVNGQTQATPEPYTLSSSASGMKLKRIPAGSFWMGSTKAVDNDADDDESPRHQVRISRDFYMGLTEVTQNQYRSIMGENPSEFKEIADGEDGLRPVENVSWSDAVRFCNALSTAEGIPTFYRIVGDTATVINRDGLGYRLPTEAEWEYACRAGQTSRYSFGDDGEKLEAHGWYGANSDDKTHPVGKKQPNAFGLFDMHGNVWEWCWDAYDGDHYATLSSPIVDPSGPPIASDRVLRGGNWNNDAAYSRSAYRHHSEPNSRDSSLGFRVVRTALSGID